MMLLLKVVAIVLLCGVTAHAGPKASPVIKQEAVRRLTQGTGHYDFPGGATLRFTTKDGALMLASGGEELYRLAPGLSISQSLTSPDRRTLLLLVTSSSPLQVPKDSDVTIDAVVSGGILRIHAERSNRLSCKLHMSDAMVPEPLRRMTISHMDSVLNDGLTVQLQVVRMSEEPGSTSSVVTAEVWDIEAPQRWRVDEDYYDEG